MTKIHTLSLFTEFLADYFFNEHRRTSVFGTQLSEADAGHSFLGRNVPRLTPDIRFRETTFRGYSDPLQTLNVELGLLPTFGV